MSRIGKVPVLVPSSVDLSVAGGTVSAKGPQGSLSLAIHPSVTVSQQDNLVTVAPKSRSKESRMLWGTYRKLIGNLVYGVDKGFSVRLEINGVGYRASVQGAVLVLQLGYSHDVRFSIPEGIKISCETPTVVTVFGADKQLVGQVASKIRSFRPPEPYKGKGIKYDGEYIVRKEGKKK